MSSRKIVTITCPQCQKEKRFEMWDSINVTFHPDLKEKVLTGQLFRFTCESCGMTGPVDYGFLYHDMTNKIMLHFLAQNQSLENEIEGFKKTLDRFKDNDGEMFERLTQSTHRFVTNRSDLIEKIQIFTAGYDDRVIELMKETIRQAKPELVKDYQAFIFGEDVDNKPYFFIVYDANRIEPLPFNKEQYDQIMEMYQSKFSATDYSVNLEWAQSLYTS